jgi:hypothetical protein
MLFRKGAILRGLTRRGMITHLCTFDRVLVVAIVPLVHQVDTRDGTIVESSLFPCIEMPDSALH